MSDDQALIDAVAAHVLVPLVAGGDLVPVPPIGAKRALALARQPIVAASDDLPRSRLRAARALSPVDELPDPDAGEWLCAFALNDLLQVTNPTLDGIFDHDRASRLLDMVVTVIDAAGAPGTVAATLSRHATFGRLLALSRVDTRVSWWVGHRDFRGAEPPARLLAWPRVRRVHKASEDVSLVRMAPADAPWASRWLTALGTLIAASPLTDIATLGRRAPRFEWSGAALDLVAVAAGRTLALRAVERAGDVSAAVATVQSAAGRIAEDAPRRVALAFAGELEALAAARKAG